jgi:hypothetical protein
MTPCEAMMQTYEPSLGEILSDAGTRALMRADGVSRSDLEAMLARIGRRRAEHTLVGDHTVSNGLCG